MKVKAILLIVIGVFLAVTISVADQDKPAATGAEQNKGADKMELSGGSKGKVPFPHHKHQEALKDCNICHADFPQEAGSIDKLKADGKLEKKQIMNKHCVKCHREKKRAGEKTGPTSCSKCHQK